jgi:GTP cyclohydrolase I
MVVVEARHLCMEMRGARSVGVTTTSAARGIFADADRRKEFLDELRSGRSRNVDSRILR